MLTLCYLLLVLFGVSCFQPSCFQPDSLIICFFTVLCSEKYAPQLSCRFECFKEKFWFKSSVSCPVSLVALLFPDPLEHARLSRRDTWKEALLSSALCTTPNIPALLRMYPYQRIICPYLLHPTKPKGGEVCVSLSHIFCLTSISSFSRSRPPSHYHITFS